MNSSGRRGRWGRVVIAAGLIGVVVWVWQRTAWARGPASLELPGGATLRIRGVGFGTNHIGPPVLLNRIMAYLPGPWVTRLGFRPVPRVTTDNPQLVVWTEVQCPDGECAHAIGMAVAEALAGGSLVDTRGFESPLIGGVVWGGARRSSGVRIDLDAWAVEVFPRRVRYLVTRLYGRNGRGLGRGSLLGELVTPNPALQRYPAWVPETLPATNTVGGERYILHRLAVDPADRNPNTRFAAAELGMRVEGAQGRSEDWTLGGLWLADATGNLIEIDSPDTIGGELDCRVADGELRCRFPWALWSDEPAWELRVELVPHRVAALSPDQVWVIRNVRIPAEDEIVRIDASNRVAGISVRAIALVGAHAVLSGREHDVQDQVTLEIEAGDLPRDCRLLVVEPLDDRGRRVPVVMAAGNASFGLSPGAGAREISLGLAVYPKRSAVFRVRPVFLGMDR